MFDQALYEEEAVRLLRAAEKHVSHAVLATAGEAR